MPRLNFTEAELAALITLVLKGLSEGHLPLSPEQGPLNSAMLKLKQAARARRLAPDHPIERSGV